MYRVSYAISPATTRCQDALDSISQTEQRLSKKIVTFGVELGNLFYLESFDRILIAILSIS